MRAQAFGAELAIEALYERVASRFAGTRKSSVSDDGIYIIRSMNEPHFKWGSFILLMM